LGLRAEDVFGVGQRACVFITCGFSAKVVVGVISLIVRFAFSKMSVVVVAESKCKK
jgi:hypothetical protein